MRGAEGPMGLTGPSGPEGEIGPEGTKGEQGEIGEPVSANCMRSKKPLEIKPNLNFCGFSTSSFLGLFGLE